MRRPTVGPVRAVQLASGGIALPFDEDTTDDTTTLPFVCRNGGIDRDRNNPPQAGLSDWPRISEEETVPVILLWAIPAVIVIGGSGYWLTHLHH